MKRTLIIAAVVILGFALLLWVGYKWAASKPPATETATPIEAAAVTDPVTAEVPEPAGSKFFPIDISSVANTTIVSAFNGTPNLPSGDVTLGGVPFHLPSGRNCWSSLNAQGTVSINIPVDIYGVWRVDTLMNAVWGQQGTEARTLEFFGDKGAHYKKVLVDGIDIRDWNEYTNVNTINNTSTTRVWEGQGVRAEPFDKPTRMDKQRIVLPAEFRSQKLTKITLTDSGSANVSRTLFSGITMSAVGGDAPASAPGGQ